MEGQCRRIFAENWYGKKGNLVKETMALGTVTALALLSLVSVPAGAETKNAVPVSSICTNAENASKNGDKFSIGIPWTTIGWQLFKNGGRYIERQIKLDGSTKVSSDQIYLVSPSINYNSGNIGPEFYFRPNIRSNAHIYMHGHRLFALDVFAITSLILSDAKGNTVTSLNAGSNQYLEYNVSASDPKGSWKAQYITNSPTTWQNYFRAYLGNQNKSKTQVDEFGNITFYDKNKRFFVGNSDEIHNTMKRANSHRMPLDYILTIDELENQFHDSRGRIVDQMNDYMPGDIVKVSSPIAEVSFDPTLQATAFRFQLSNNSSNAPKNMIVWYFNGDLTQLYRAGDTPVFTFKVKQIADSNGTIFEGLDYFEDAFNLQRAGIYPDLFKYVH